LPSSWAPDQAGDLQRPAARPLGCPQGCRPGHPGDRPGAAHVPPLATPGGPD